MAGLGATVSVGSSGLIGSSGSGHCNDRDTRAFDAKLFTQPRTGLPGVSIGFMISGVIGVGHGLYIYRHDEKVHVIELPDDDGLIPLLFERSEDS